MDVRVGPKTRLSAEELTPSNCDAGEDSRESLGQQGDQTSQFQRTLSSLLQHHSSKASVLQHLAFLIAQLSHLYVTTEKNHSFDYMDFCWQSNVSAFEYAI